MIQAGAELCQAQVKLEVVVEVGVEFGVEKRLISTQVEVVVEVEGKNCISNTSALYLFI